MLGKSIYVFLVLLFVQLPQVLVHDLHQRVIQQHEVPVQVHVPIKQVHEDNVVVVRNSNCPYRRYGNCHTRTVQQPIHQTVTQTVQVVEQPVVVQRSQTIIQTSCHVNPHCHDVPQRHSQRITECPPGHYLTPDGTHCKHIDCDHGLHFSDKLLTCVDIDECETSHPCHRDETCVNTHGSYICKKICTTAGYRHNPLTNACDDINECHEGSHLCGPQQTCINRPGGHDCDCPKGFRINGRYCDDINECHVHQHICPYDVSYCENIPGEYKCVCKQGFKEDPLRPGKNCIDIDECAYNNGGCSHTCINKFGSHLCTCHAGFRLSSDGKTCLDIDECAEGGTSLCFRETSTCINTLGTYICECKKGFRDDGTHKNCIDIDECAEHTSNCQQRCQNTHGSYKCGCEKGYRLVGEHKCEDIDECHEVDLVHTHTSLKYTENVSVRPHLCHGHCENTLGSYKCTCPHGYKLENFHHCTDIDECKDHTCNSDEYCVNMAGSHRCERIICPHGYYRDGYQCKRSKELNYQQLCDNPPHCHVDQVVCYSYSWVPFRSNHPIPSSGSLEFYTFVVPIESPVIAEFDLRLVSARPSHNDVPAASRDDFILRRSKDNEVKIGLLRPLKGPQDIELEITVKMFKHGVHVGTNKANVYVYVSQYDF